MDIAKAFEILSQGRIVSSNSSQYSELANMLLNESFFNELNELIMQLGYKLIGESGYFYIAKRSRLNATEQQAFITKHRELIVGVSFLRHLYPRLDRGSVISYTETSANYSNTKKEDSSIKEKLIYFSWIKNKDDEKGMLEQLFKYLEDKNIIEKVHESNTDRYKILDSINYYLSIVDAVETGE
jgi:hypothetical protein